MESAIDEFLRNDVSSSEAEGTDATNMTTPEAAIDDATPYEKRIRDLVSFAASVDVEGCKDDLSELLKLGQRVSQRRAELYPLMRAPVPVLDSSIPFLYIHICLCGN